MSKQSDTSVDTFKMNKEEKQRMQAFLEIVGDRIEVLEYLVTYSYFFPDWQKTINEALLESIDKKQALNVSCDEEKEMLTNINFFFTKMAYHSGLISEWHKEIANGKSQTEELLSKM